MLIKSISMWLQTHLEVILRFLEPESTSDSANVDGSLFADLTFSGQKQKILGNEPVIHPLSAWLLSQ